jgi:hypothetical protein
MQIATEKTTSLRLAIGAAAVHRIMAHLRIEMLSLKDFH